MYELQLFFKAKRGLHTKSLRNNGLDYLSHVTEITFFKLAQYLHLLGYNICLNI
jgi:hypothetical protein